MKYVAFTSHRAREAAGRIVDLDKKPLFSFGHRLHFYPISDAKAKTLKDTKSKALKSMKIVDELPKLKGGNQWLNTW